MTEVPALPEKIDLKLQLERLIGLQDIDKRIYRLNEEALLLPEEIKKLEAAFEEKKAGVAAAEKRLLDVQKQRKEKELELAAKDESAKKLQSQLYALKTNQEYQAMLRQINDAKADSSVIEDALIALFDAADKAKQQVDQEKAILAREEKGFAEQKLKVDARMKEIAAEIAAEQARRNVILPGIDAKVLAQYERVLKIRAGQAITAIENENCTGCGMRVTKQTENLVRLKESLVTCDVCNRILYIP
jgi:hypothetical protein